ncbi:MAG: nitrilase-related carbon-nitrogen hydrolase, partial [Planctomycetota bacterium]
MPVKVALCQMHVKAGRVAENIRTAESMIARAAKRGAEVAVLPEMWPTGFDFSRMDEYGRSAELKGLSKRTSQLAESLKVHLAAGSWLHFTRDGKRPGACNRAHFFAKDGRLIAHYDKIHLFPPMLEDRFLRPGRRPRVFNSILGKT